MGPDKIHLNGMVFYGYHGVLPEVTLCCFKSACSSNPGEGNPYWPADADKLCWVQENKLGQKFVVDAQLYCDLMKPGMSDDLRDTVDYSAVYKCAT